MNVQPESDETTDDEDLPRAASRVVEFGWDCPACGECNGTADVDEAGTVQGCEWCGINVRVTT
jgi:hypothetical protein